MYIFGESQVYRLKYYKAVQQFVLGVHDQMAYEWIWISVLLVVQPLRPKFASRVKVGPRPGSSVRVWNKIHISAGPIISAPTCVYFSNIQFCISPG
jgi:hypothetical protein